MAHDRTLLTGDQVLVAGIDDWSFDGQWLTRSVETDNFVEGLALVNRIGELAEASNHHPDLELRYSGVVVRTSSHDAGGVTSRDVDLARGIDALVADHSPAAPSPEPPSDPGPPPAIT